MSDDIEQRIQHYENLTKLSAIEGELEAHSKEDARRFDGLDKKLDELHSDVKSLLETRTFSKGVYWVLAGIGATLLAFATGLLDLLSRIRMK